jgi:hypothetical protein
MTLLETDWSYTNFRQAEIAPTDNISTQGPDPPVSTGLKFSGFGPDIVGLRGTSGGFSKMQVSGWFGFETDQFLNDSPFMLFALGARNDVTRLQPNGRQPFLALEVYVDSQFREPQRLTFRHVAEGGSGTGMSDNEVYVDNGGDNGFYRFTIEKDGSQLTAYAEYLYNGTWERLLDDGTNNPATVTADLSNYSFGIPDGNAGLGSASDSDGVWYLTEMDFTYE